MFCRKQNEKNLTAMFTFLLFSGHKFLTYLSYNEIIKKRLLVLVRCLSTSPNNNLNLYRLLPPVDKRQDGSQRASCLCHACPATVLECIWKCKKAGLLRLSQVCVRKHIPQLLFIVYNNSLKNASLRDNFSINSFSPPNLDELQSKQH